jgi:hypothetical protein
MGETSMFMLADGIGDYLPIRRRWEQCMKLSRLKERLRHGADVCQITQQKIVSLENAPGDRKRLRQFPTVEAAMVLAVSESYLRQITKEGAELHAELS